MTCPMTADDMNDSHNLDGYVNCSNSSDLAKELLQSCTKPSMYRWILLKDFVLFQYFSGFRGEDNKDKMHTFGYN